MAQRAEALCNGEIIDIESIFTVIEGKQINIPDKLKELRAKSRNKELFCPCGCGTNLVLVAGDRNLVQQHFRSQKGSKNKGCIIKEENQISIDSKVVLKCWLDDKLKASDIRSRVPINTICKTKRKPEFTYLSLEKNFAIRYWFNRTNIAENKIEAMDSNLPNLQIYYIVDYENEVIDGQYPEWLMKVQNKQGFCLTLVVAGKDYSKARLKVIFYDKDIKGHWKKFVAEEGSLSSFCIQEGHITYNGTAIETLVEQEKERVKQEKQRELEDIERKKREEAERKAYLAEQKRLQAEEWERKRQLAQQRREAQLRLEQQRKEAERKKREEEEENRRKELELFLAKQREKDLEHRRQQMAQLFSQQTSQIRDNNGNRLLQCESCGKIDKDDAFATYGGTGHINLGTCKDCMRKRMLLKK